MALQSNLMGPCFGLLIILVLASTVGYGDQPHPTAELLRQHPIDSWLTNGGNLYNQRYSPLKQINVENVSGLKGVWRARLNGSGVGTAFSGEAQPLILDGVIYTITGADDVFAVDIETGEILWEYQSGLDPALKNICCSWTSRGVGLGDGKIFVGRLDGKLLALDIKTGKEIWNVQAERWQEGLTLTSAPLYYEGKVITGFAGAEYGVRGRVKAYSAENGELLWTFYTIPAPGEPGSDTWPKNSDIWQRGGGTVWHRPAVDPELGLLYFSTGNPGPAFNGAVREGDNLFTVSMIALDVSTGEYRWHYQQIHHDIWDYDASSPVVLFDMEYEGEMRKAIAEAGKTGWVYILDRITGEPLLGIDEQPVVQEPRQKTASTQPIPRGDAFAPQKMEMPLAGYKFVNEGHVFTPYWKEKIPVRPSSFGGTTWAPSSFDPRNKHLFVCGQDLVGLYVGGDEDGAIKDGEPQEQFLGGDFLFDSVRTGIFAAVDMKTNRLVWRQRWEDSCYSGSTVTAGDLVFTGKNDGRFVALDSRNGDVLWEFQTGAGVNAPPAVFEFQGKQFVAIYAAGALFAQSPRGDNLWLFSLEGELDEVAPDSSSGAAALKASGVDGAEVYATHCKLCHGANGEGGHGGGPALIGDLNPLTLKNTVTRGKGQMPAFGNTLTYDQFEAVLAYLKDGLGQ
ncbi:MAG: PQQ-binding-like beta-propeller repeat protein [Pseudomonadota bacterium]